MPNPFKQPGTGYQTSTDWLAVGVGLLGKLAAQEAKGGGANLALVGAVGSGKTTALAAYKRGVSVGEPIFLAYALDRLAAEAGLELHALVYRDLVAKLGSDHHDEAAAKEGLRGPGLPGPPRRDEVFKLIRGMIALSVEKSHGTIHVLVDECQVPAEAFEREASPAKRNRWFDELKAVGETVNNAGGRMVITITPNPWQEAPEHMRARFVELATQAPDAGEILAFVREGLKHTGGDNPSKAQSSLGTAIETNSAATAPLTIRALHAMLHGAWDRAHAKDAKILGPTHVG